MNNTDNTSLTDDPTTRISTGVYANRSANTYLNTSPGSYNTSPGSYIYNFKRCSSCMNLLRCNNCYSNYCVNCTDINYCYECDMKYCAGCRDVLYCDGCEFTYCIDCRIMYECTLCNLYICDTCTVDTYLVRQCSCCKSLYCKSCIDVFLCKKTKKMVCTECIATCIGCHFNYNKNYCVGNVCADCKFNLIINSKNDISSKFPIEIIMNIQEFL